MNYLFQKPQSKRVNKLNKYPYAKGFKGPTKF